MMEKIFGGRYEVVKYLASGGFSNTFLAADKHLPGNPNCVVKQLKLNHASSSYLPIARRLFTQEAEVLYRLGCHGQIPQLLANFEEKKEFYLVEEFIQGESLTQELLPSNKLTEEQVLKLLREILEILVFVHQQNVIHRDIKPTNLIRRDQDGKLVLIDFGAVKQITTQIINSPTQNSYTIAIGSPGYMPNEQLAGKPRFCSDIYAVGIIGIEALTGLAVKYLPEAPHTYEIVWREHAQVSLELGNILDKMVRYDFRQRYQSATEVLRELDSLSTQSESQTMVILMKTSQPLLQSLPTQLPTIAEGLNSERGIDYTKLQELLAAAKWQDADRETKTVMLKAADREWEGWLRSEDLESMPCADLNTINSLWVRASNGRFGFSVQMQIYTSLAQSSNDTQAIWRQFGQRVGWFEDDVWLSSDRLIYDLDAPVGQLPSAGGVGRFWELTGSYLVFLSRVNICQQQSAT
ncbi:MAG: serine/threonine-protein kinase [Microcoleaceae cyanobacterium MO_207.B10]|nr:serine/threonine-protein kinase [Microcoleaceae cyanobacterium MO_207.B10]